MITADGKGIPVRPEALRAGTAKLAAKAKQSPPCATSGNAGGKGNSKRMAELVCVYDPGGIFATRRVGCSFRSVLMVMILPAAALLPPSCWPQNG